MGASIITTHLKIFKTFGFLKVFKIFRLRRLNKFVNQINVENKTKSIITIWKVSFYLFLYLHFVACVWYKLAMANPHIDRHFDVDREKQHDDRHSKVWVPVTYWMDYTENLIYSDAISQFEKYSIFFYHAIMFLNLQEVAPVTEDTIVFCVCCLLFSIPLQIYIVS